MLQSDMTGPIEHPPRLPEAKDFPATGPFSLAAPGPRFGARAIDLALVLAPALVVISLSIREVGEQMQLDAPAWLLFAIVGLGMAYEFVCVALFGRTVGKALMGLRVVRYTDGHRPNIAQAALRAIVPWSALALPLGPFALGAFLIVYGTSLSGDLHRGIPDQAAGTIIISTR
jgi:uncharacterized RDD family membrane protein YckC